MRMLLLNMFQLTDANIEEEYQEVSEVLFQDRSKSNILIFPSFTDSDYIVQRQSTVQSEENQIKFSYEIINKKGKKLMKRVFWMLK